MPDRTRPLRILARCHLLRPGGAPNMLSTLLRALAARHSITLLKLDRSDESLMAANAAAGIAFLENARPDDYDVLLANTLLSSEVVVQAARQMPVVWWIHEAAIGRSFIKQGMVDTGAFTQATKIVFPGPRQPRDVYADYLLRDNWVIVPSAIPEPGGVSRKRPTDASFRVLQVGGVSKVKGQNVTIDALRLLDRGAFEACFVGPDHGDWAQEVKRSLSQAKTRPLAIDWSGELSQDDSLQAIADADVLVYPRRVTSFPLAVQEAMALSVPVICARCPAIEDVVRDGQELLLTDDSDAASMAGAIARLQGDPALRQRLAQNAKAYVTEQRPYGTFLEAMERQLYRAVEDFGAMKR